MMALLLAVTATSAFAQGKWWQQERFQRELQLGADQISRIEEVFQAAIPELRQQKKALDQLETRLSRLIDTSADETAVMQEADRVEAAGAGRSHAPHHLSKARTRMLLRIRRVLTAEQRVKLGALHEEWERERKRQDHRK
jgi:Spy/CpxP family protein refolding chaperone